MVSLRVSDSLRPTKRYIVPSGTMHDKVGRVDVTVTSCEHLNQRHSVRIPVDYQADYRVTGGDAVREGRVTDLSAGGFLIEVTESLTPGTGLAVTLRSNDQQLVTAAWVLRCQADAEGRYQVACAFD